MDGPFVSMGPRLPDWPRPSPGSGLHEQYFREFTCSRRDRAGRPGDRGGVQLCVTSAREPARRAGPGRSAAQRQRAERQPADPQRLGLRLQHRAFLVERGEQAGHLEQVRAQPVRLRGLADLGHRRAEAEQPQRERPLRAGGDRDPAERARPPRPRSRRRRPGGRSSGSARWRTAGTGRCCRGTRSSGPSRARRRSRGRWTGRRTSPRRCRPPRRPRPVRPRSKRPAVSSSSRMPRARSTASAIRSLSLASRLPGSAAGCRPGR